MLIVYAAIVHLLLLGSIFVIYFRSPVLTGLQPQAALTSYGLEAPAKRLVLFVADGLRAESFYHNNCSDVPHLRNIILQQGLVGVSRTRVPTESRPGHIALIAGLYEDPSAVTRGWKENPIEFDSVFNRSGHTFAWGAHDVLHLFSHISKGMLIDSYDELNFSSHDKTYDQDEWVFKRVRKFLKLEGAKLRDQQQVIFFLHLLGLDTAGHVHKPGSQLFLENLHYTDRGISEIYKEFERVFPDGRTAYIFTSDHGMTNTGSHGAGELLETDTPFIVWGAGVREKIEIDSENIKAELVLEQAQFAPLMSAFLGLPPPMNNFGKLPLGLLNVTAEYEARAVHTNALQLLEQYQKLWGEHNRGSAAAFLNRYEKLDEEHIVEYISNTEKRFAANDYKVAIEDSNMTMQLALDGIEYYHSYYQNALLLSTTAIFLGWILYLLQLLVPVRYGKQQSINQTPLVVSLSLVAVGMCLTVFALIQRLPFAIAVYLIAPVFVWLLTIRHGRATLLQRLRELPLFQLLLLILCAELLVFTFFERGLISLGFLLFALISNSRAFVAKDMKFFIWTLLVLFLSIFPLLPPSVGYQNIPLLLFGAALITSRPFLSNSRFALHNKLIPTVAIANAMVCAYLHTNQIGISLISQVISWLFLIYAFMGILFTSKTKLKQRLELTFLNLTALYVLFCTSYEAIFVLMLASELVFSLSAQHSNNDSLQIEIGSSATTKQISTSFRIAFAIILYTYFSFFGTGNIASISSFDPNIIRCFLTTFSPFSIMALIIMKLVLPVILCISIIFGLSAHARENERQIFICVLLVCDVMGLNFLFLVRNQGSWLEIGSSISNFVITEVTTLILLLLTIVAKCLLGLRLNFWSDFKTK